MAWARDRRSEAEGRRLGWGGGGAGKRCHACARARTHTRTHTHARTHARTHTHTCSSNNNLGSIEREEVTACCSCGDRCGGRGGNVHAVMRWNMSYM